MIITLNRRENDIISMIILFFSYFILSVRSDALSYKLGPYEKSCFYQPITNATGTKLYFYFANQGQDQKVDVTILDPMQNILFSGINEAFGERSFDLNLVGDYSFCFSNAQSFNSKVIDFDISESQEDADVVNVKSGMSGNKLESFENVISKLTLDLRTIQNYQRHLKNRDVRNHDTVKSTDNLIFWFSIFQLLLMMGMAGLQVYILKKFFTSSGKVRV